MLKRIVTCFVLSLCILFIPSNSSADGLTANNETFQNNEHFYIGDLEVYYKLSSVKAADNSYSFYLNSNCSGTASNSVTYLNTVFSVKRPVDPIESCITVEVNAYAYNSSITLTWPYVLSGGASASKEKFLNDQHFLIGTLEVYYGTSSVKTNDGSLSLFPNATCSPDTGVDAVTYLNTVFSVKDLSDPGASCITVLVDSYAYGTYIELTWPHYLPGGSSAESEKFLKNQQFLIGTTQVYYYINSIWTTYGSFSLYIGEGCTGQAFDSIPYTNTYFSVLNDSGTCVDVVYDYYTYNGYAILSWSIGAVNPPEVQAVVDQITATGSTTQTETILSNLVSTSSTNNKVGSGFINALDAFSAIISNTDPEGTTKIIKNTANNVTLKVSKVDSSGTVTSGDEGFRVALDSVPQGNTFVLATVDPENITSAPAEAVGKVMSFDMKDAAGDEVKDGFTIDIRIPKSDVATLSPVLYRMNPETGAFYDTAIPVTSDGDFWAFTLNSFSSYVFVSDDDFTTVATALASNTGALNYLEHADVFTFASGVTLPFSTGSTYTNKISNMLRETTKRSAGNTAALSGIRTLLTTVFNISIGSSDPSVIINALQDWRKLN